MGKDCKHVCRTLFVVFLSVTMLFSLVFILGICAFCMKKSPVTILGLFLVILPYHNFISSFLELFAGGKGLFPIWREICIVALFVKTKAYNRLHRNVLPVLFIIYVILICTLYWGKYQQNLSSTRLYISYAVLLMSVPGIKFDFSRIYYITKVFLLSSFVVCVGGFIQYFLVRKELHVLMGDYVLRPWGKIELDAPNWTIMGYERMAGFVGVPNIFGLITSVSSFVCVALLTEKREYLRRVSNADQNWLKVILVLSIFCMILSFSRTGWVIFVGAFGALLIKRGKIFDCIKWAGYSIVVSMVFVAIAFFVMPESFDIIYDSLSGNESSVSRRRGMLEHSLAIMSSMSGNGIGGTDIKSGDYFAESAVLNVVYEIGVLGLLFWGIMLFMNYFLCPHRCLWIFSVVIPISIVAAFPQSNIVQSPYVYYMHICAGLAINKSIYKKYASHSIDCNSDV
ncbi:MAG: O-antigen ligase family protein [Bacteroidales bacterium]|nr:O-antigen ligase family protein [Bacteroidales bacterium]